MANISSINLMIVGSLGVACAPCVYAIYDDATWRKQQKNTIPLYVFGSTCVLQICVLGLVWTRKQKQSRLLLFLLGGGHYSAW